jgi:hypothetical protein
LASSNAQGRLANPLVPPVGSAPVGVRTVAGDQGALKQAKVVGWLPARAVSAKHGSSMVLSLMHRNAPAVATAIEVEKQLPAMRAAILAVTVPSAEYAANLFGVGPAVAGDRLARAVEALVEGVAVASLRAVLRAG